MSNPRLQTLIHKRELLKIETISGCRDHKIGNQLFGPLILIGKVQSDAPIPRFGLAEPITDENWQMANDAFFQPPASGGAE